MQFIRSGHLFVEDIAKKLPFNQKLLLNADKEIPHSVLVYVACEMAGIAPFSGAGMMVLLKLIPKTKLPLERFVIHDDKGDHTNI